MTIRSVSITLKDLTDLVQKYVTEKYQQEIEVVEIVSWHSTKITIIYDSDAPKVIGEQFGHRAR